MYLLSKYLLVIYLSLQNVRYREGKEFKVSRFLGCPNQRSSFTLSHWFSENRFLILKYFRSFPNARDLLLCHCLSHIGDRLGEGGLALGLETVKTTSPKSSFLFFLSFHLVSACSSKVPNSTIFRSLPPENWGLSHFSPYPTGMCLSLLFQMGSFGVPVETSRWMLVLLLALLLIC